MTRLRGVLAAAVTPFAPDGSVDIQRIPGLAAFYAAQGLDGLLVLGTTGEGVLLDPGERQRVAEAFVGESRVPVAVHCGAQSTRDTLALCTHARSIGAAAVAVIPPPYYAIDERSLFEHLRAAASACAPLPFYVYEFAARSGYAVPVAMVGRLLQEAPNLAGMKVSDATLELVAPYLVDGVDVFIGAESLIHAGLERGAVGAVSGLAAALPELTIEAVRSRSAEASARAAAVRDLIQAFPFQAALKLILRRRGVDVGETVRAPLRQLDGGERTRLLALIEAGALGIPAASIA